MRSVLFAALLLSTPAMAQQQCIPVATLVDDLGERYDEQIVWQGVVAAPNGGRVEIMLFQSAKGSFTIAAVQGITACILSTGQDATPIETGKGI